MADPFPDDPRSQTVALILAGGRGSRLAPLTDARSKPAVPFAGQYRLIDVALTTLAHSGVHDVWVVEQYRPFTLNQHLAGGRPWDLDGTRHGLRLLPPAQGRDEEGFARGNGHALHQQLAPLRQFGAGTVIIMSADHLYRIDLRPVLAQHRERGSELTVVTTQVDEDVSRFGVVQTDADGRVTDYDYKPDAPATDVVATEIFVADVEALTEVTQSLLAAPADRPGETVDDDDPVGAELGDYGETIIPALVRRGRAHEYRHRGYWKDVGTIDAYYQAHMQLLRGEGLDLTDERWPLLSNFRAVPPAMIDARAEVRGSLVCPGARVAGRVEESVIGPRVVVEPGASVRRSVLLGSATVPAGAHLDAVVADVGAEIPAERTGESKPGPGNITVLVPADRDAPGDETTGAGEVPLD